MRNNNQTNQFIQWIVTIGDFLLLNVIILLATRYYWRVETWSERSLQIFILVNNVALVLSEIRFSTVIHLRLIGAGDVVQRLVGLSMCQTVLAYALLKIFDYYLPIGWLLLGIGTLFFILLIFKRIVERWFIRLYRSAGRNSRAVTLVGPRPHMLLHTEMYSELIDKYMVRHFVKPGLTGWAQVTGFRGETKELWQMEGRVKRDIWYMEHWSIWLDIRIIWMTVKTIFVHDKNAY